MDYYNKNKELILIQIKIGKQKSVIKMKISLCFLFELLIATLFCNKINKIGM